MRFYVKYPGTKIKRKKVEFYTGLGHKLKRQFNVKEDRIMDLSLNHVFMIRKEKAEEFLRELENPHASKEFIQECVAASKNIKRRNRKKL
jgi:predicted lactoylglutathione lyase